jgi:16S rRNA (guanine966-N2)-methyltransferase
MLQSRVGSFQGLRIGDLFAGTGALGLEALSRGAAHCLFLDSDRNAVASIQRNIAALGAAARADIRSQALEYAPPPLIPCDILFLDPPYRTGLSVMALERVCNPAWVALGGYVSLESDGETSSPPAGFEVETERRFGKAHILLLRR